MLTMSEICTGTARFLREKTGVPAFTQRMEHALYPSLLVSCTSHRTELLAGGRQVLQQAELQVVCYPSRQREREEGMALCDRVQQALLQGFALGDRSLRPEGVCAEPDEKGRFCVRFLLEYCDIPAQSRPEAEQAVPMGSLKLSIRHREEEI